MSGSPDASAPVFLFGQRRDQQVCVFFSSSPFARSDTSSPAVVAIMVGPGHRNIHGKRHSDYAENGGGKRRNPGDDTYAPGPDDTVYRYLCVSRKIGSIIGRGGEIAKQLRNETQAKIRIGESVPGCDERVITIFSPSRETNTIEDTEDKVCPAQDALFRVHEKLATDDGPVNEENEEGLGQVTVRLLVPTDQIGCIIGKGGHIIQGICSDTGSKIRVLSKEHLPACAISGDELLQFFEDPVSPTIDATVRLQPKCSEKIDAESGEPSYTTRLLVSTSRIGCLIGKGGSIVTEIRRTSRANIRIFSKENVPKVALASEDEEMVQISGDLDVARHALVQITTRLKANFFEREGALSGFPSVIPYHPLPASVSDEPRLSGSTYLSSGKRYGY
ncbi:hypothetical protein ACQ4PT_049606 [Festuca glaucescens]